MSSELRPDSLGERWVHLCVDLQVMFREKSAWAFTWPDKMLENVCTICEHNSEKTIFTRFLPVSHPGDGHGSWRRLYQRWDSITIERLGFENVELVPELKRFQYRSRIVDRATYSPWTSRILRIELQQRTTQAVVISGVEVDMCVLAAVLGAIDRGYRTILLTDAIHSSAPSSQEAVLSLLQTRFSEQLELTNTAAFVDKISRENTTSQSG
jgi:nicotinamidase-related amidase